MIPLTLAQLKERERELLKALQWIEEEMDFSEDRFHLAGLEREWQRAGEEWARAKEALDKALKKV